MKKKFLATIMSLTLGAAMLTACGSSVEEETVDTVIEGSTEIESTEVESTEAEVVEDTAEAGTEVETETVEETTEAGTEVETEAVEETTETETEAVEETTETETTEAAVN